ncbi:GbsR/MarR family transcriptional regulator [Methanocaldococcus sp.]
MDAKKIIINMFSEIAKIHGLNKSVGAIYGLLFYNGREMSMDEIVKELKISKGNVSMSLRKLEELGFIKKVWKEGERKTYYKINEGFSSIKDIAKKKYDVIKNSYQELKNSDLDESKLKEIEKMLKISKKILEYLEEIES